MTKSRAKIVLLTFGVILVPANLAGLYFGPWIIAPVGVLGYLYMKWHLTRYSRS